MKKPSGNDLEKTHSKSFHQHAVPLLVSPDLLRKRDLGQIDLARLKKERSGWILEIAEVKSSGVGEEMMMRNQRKRLFSSQNFLSGIFGIPSRLIRFVGEFYQAKN